MNSMIQPYIAMSASKYYKNVVNTNGISHFYQFTKDNTHHQQVLAVPDGCIDIFFSFRDQQPYAEIIGSVLKPTFILDGKASDYFGVRFHPGGGYKFKDAKIEDIISHVCDFTELMDVEGLVEQIVTSNNFSDKMHLFTTHFQKHLYQQSIDLNPLPLKDFMLSKVMASNGQIRVSELAVATGYSERYVNKKFNELFGISPKMFCKIVRFQHILNQLKVQSNTLNADSLTQLATDAGYYDQAHMCKDFNEFSEQSPSQYIKMLRQTDYNNKLVLT